MSGSPLHERLRIAVGDRSYRHLGDLTGTHPETVRRYVLGQSPSAEFLTALCSAVGISAEWLLTGRGPMRSADMPSYALRQASAPDLLEAIAGALERLIERVDRIEAYVQTLETRVRARVDPEEDTPHAHSPHIPHSPLADIRQRARGIAQVIPQRPR